MEHIETPLDNFVSDPRLSLEAKGVLGMMKARRTSEPVSLAWLASHARDDESVIQAASLELLAHGYITRSGDAFEVASR